MSDWEKEESCGDPQVDADFRVTREKYKNMKRVRDRRAAALPPHAPGDDEAPRSPRP